MAVYGYIKNNYPESTAKQLECFKDYTCTEILVDGEVSSDTKMLNDLLESLQNTDEVIIYDLRSFFMNIRSLKDVFSQLDSKNIRLISIQDEIDSRHSSTFYHDLIQVFIMDEKHKSHVVRVSIEKARSEGRIGGRPKINEELVNIMTKMYRNERKTIREIAEICDVSIGTVHKYINLKKLIE